MWHENCVAGALLIHLTKNPSCCLMVRVLPWNIYISIHNVLIIWNFIRSFRFTGYFLLRLWLHIFYRSFNFSSATWTKNSRALHARARILTQHFNHHFDQASESVEWVGMGGWYIAGQCLDGRCFGYDWRE